VKTDRRAAMHLARRMRAGDRTPVSGPAVADAAMRALRRARAETLRELQAAKLRRKACLLRQDIRSPGPAHWRPAPRRWLREVVWATPAPQIVLQAYVHTVPEQTARLHRLESALYEQGTPWRLSPVVEALQALRGGQLTGAVTTGAELGDRTRFAQPRPRMHSLGLTPAEYSSGAQRQPGSMTKTGHPQARRVLVEGAWASRSPATGRRHLPLRLAQRPSAMQASSWKAQVRRCKRYRPLMATGKNAHQGVGAMARELRACMWALAQQVPVRPAGERSLGVLPPPLDRVATPLEEAQPRWGVSLGGVTRRNSTLAPRLRQAPDGGKEGGTQPTDSRRINRRHSWRRLFQGIKEKRRQM
jgi:transposase